MTYSLVSAVGKPVGGAGRWLAVDISNMSFHDIYANYLRCIATLSNPYDATETALDLATIQFTIPDPSVTFGAYLAGLGDASLPTTTTLPVLKTTYAKYNDAWRAGYTITPVPPNASPDLPLPIADKTWLKLTQTGVDFDLFNKSCMVSVNGYWHYMAADSTGAYIRDGMVSNTLSNEATCGIWNLGNLGSLQYIDITPSMVYKQNSANNLSDGVYINLGVPIAGKTVLLVIGGYLSVLDPSTFFQVGDTSIKIDWDNFPYFDRFYESRGTIDMSSLGLLTTQNNDSQVSTADLLSDRAITAYCSLSQSFVVLLDNTEVFVDHKDVRPLKVPGTYISYIDPWYPLVTGRGKVSEYWSTYETGQWGLTVIGGKIDLRTYYTTDPKQLNSLAAQRIPDTPFRISPAQFLMLGTDVSVI
ncbi:MAG: hypothetical protein P4L77_11415 [Sulfuriferula sp.]|nr:hypothetical protein [Sulfuriferula sp.]